MSLSLYIDGNLARSTDWDRPVYLDKKGRFTMDPPYNLLLKLLPHCVKSGHLTFANVSAAHRFKIVSAGYFAQYGDTAFRVANFAYNTFFKQSDLFSWGEFVVKFLFMKNINKDLREMKKFTTYFRIYLNQNLREILFGPKAKTDTSAAFEKTSEPSFRVDCESSGLSGEEGSRSTICRSEKSLSNTASVDVLSPVEKNPKLIFINGVYQEVPFNIRHLRLSLELISDLEQSISAAVIEIIVRNIVTKLTGKKILYEDELIHMISDELKLAGIFLKKLDRHDEIEKIVGLSGIMHTPSHLKMLKFVNPTNWLCINYPICFA